ncbi:MAG TPA: hypothetical protein VLR50_19550 [Desulfobacterales bacterium]|nr:hypothetical protein [Desulfobacterales bacterium]
MLIHDGIYSWEGFGGKLRLASGQCRLRVYDLTRRASRALAHLRPLVVIVSDVPGRRISVRSCAGHVATSVARDFKIDPLRMLFIEYYPESVYGEHQDHVIPERYEAVDFTWTEGGAIQPKWRTLQPPLLDAIKLLIGAASPPQDG